MNTKLTVAIVEDHDIFRKRLRELLGFYDHIEVSFCTASGEKCEEKLLDEGIPVPDVILMDIELPGISGIETTFRIKEQFPEVEVIMFTIFEDDERLFESIQVGATGYLLKDTPIDDVVTSIEEVKKGGSPISPTIARKMMQLVANPPKEEDKREHIIPFQLSTAERRILEHVVDGKSNKEIAEVVFLSPWTVKTHIKNIYRKMQVSSRAAAVKLAIQRNVV
ncbi:MAG: response regulator transcription factor [Bacteroidota bacterium]